MAQGQKSKPPKEAGGKSAGGKKLPKDKAKRMSASDARQVVAEKEGKSRKKGLFSRKEKARPEDEIDSRNVHEIMEDAFVGESLEPVFEKQRSELASKFVMGFILVTSALGVIILSTSLLGLVFGGNAASEAAIEAEQSQIQQSRETRAEALAQNFAAAYLNLSSDESSSEIRERLEPLLAGGLSGEDVAPVTEGVAGREVLSASVQDTRNLGDGRFEVTVSAVTRTLSTGAGGGDDANDVETSSGEEIVTETNSLKVFVNVTDSGAAVVDPPQLVTSNTGAGSAVDGASGILRSEEGPEALTDGPEKQLLEAYFSAAYGGTDSRGGDSYYMDGVSEESHLDLPESDLEFVSLTDARFHLVPEPPEEASQAYDVEAFIVVYDPQTQTTSNQTQLLRIAEVDGEWQVAGPVGGG